MVSGVERDRKAVNNKGRINPDKIRIKTKVQMAFSKRVRFNMLYIESVRSGAELAYTDTGYLALKIESEFYI